MAGGNMCKSGKMNIKREDLQEHHRQYAEVIGVENLIALTEEFGGTPFYIPTTKELLKNTVYGAMMEEYDGSNIKKLAVKYGVSVSTAYKVLNGRIKKRRINPFEDKQISLF